MQQNAILSLPQLNGLPQLPIANGKLAETYRHIPFERAGTIKVRFAEPKPLEPRRIVIEDFDE